MRDIYGDEQRSYRGQPLAAHRVRAAPGLRLRRGSSPIARIAHVAAPSRPPGGAPNAARGTFTTGCQTSTALDKAAHRFAREHASPCRCPT